MVRARQTSRRIPWADRFNPPSARVLLLDLPSLQATLLDDARDELLALGDVTEAIVWKGLCWKWTLEYCLDEGATPIALLIPNPTDLQMAVPVKRDFVRSVWKRPLRRSLREGLELAAEPFDTEWGVWSIGSSTMLDELVDLVRGIIDFESRRTGTAPKDHSSRTGAIQRPSR